MKILHTGDWHIGKIVNQTHMTIDQEHVLNALVELIAIEKPDVLVIAGDIYDRAVPPVEAVELLDAILSTILLEHNIPVLMIAGNHDSPDRLGFGSQILRDKGLHIQGRFQKTPRKVVLHDDYGAVNFYLVPYAPPAVVREIMGSSDICDHDSAMKAIVDSIQNDWQPAERNVLVTHGFVRGMEQLEASESEKPLNVTMSIGGTEYVDVQRFAGFAYTALGHLHSPQSAGHERVRYAGSLLKYSFSEVSQKKSVTLVTLGKGDDIVVEYKSLVPLRDMRRVKGKIKDLLEPSVYQNSNIEDYLHVTLTDEGELLDPMSKLRAVYPNILGLDMEVRERVTGESRTSASQDYKDKSKMELFREFYCSITGQEFAEKQAAIVGGTIQAVEAADGGEAR